MTGTAPNGPHSARRHECKYEIDEDLALAIRDAIAPHVVPDAHAAGRPGLTYPIASLYFDTPELTLYRETTDGKDRRFKLRIRAYSDDPAVPVFLEVKHRQGALVAKSRLRARRDALDALDGAFAVVARPSPALDGEFVFHMHRLDARPRAVVRYDREAWVGAIDDEVRVTFDRRLRYLATDRIELPVESRRFVELPSDKVVLELKFNGACPYWIQVLVRHFGLQRQSFSKYGHSIDALADVDGTVPFAWGN